MTLSTQPCKGAREFYSEYKRLQKYLFGFMHEVVDRFGYEEYDAPVMEPLELYPSKTSDEERRGLIRSVSITKDYRHAK